MTVVAPRRFDRTQTTMFFDPSAEPLAELADGERIVVETEDSICGLAKREAPRGFHIDEIVDRLGGACPVTGPFYVDGAHAGGALEVELHRVDAAPEAGEAWTGVFAGFGALQHERYSVVEAAEPELRLVPYADGVARLAVAGGDIEIPLRPFLGTVGVAPRRERRMTFSQDPEYLGDVDIPQLTAGATLVLPVNVDGGLLGLGDAHAAQGDGEITGAALEIEAEVELTVRAAERGRSCSRCRRSTPRTGSARSPASRASRSPTAYEPPTATCCCGSYDSTASAGTRHTSCSARSAASRSGT